MISIVIPVYNEQKTIGKALDRIFQIAEQSLLKEVIVVQCQDEIYDVTTVLSPKKGRPAQMNYGASLAKGDILLFLHADTVLPNNALSLIEKEKVGAFSLRFDDTHLFFSFLGFLSTLRSRIFRIPYGDQAFFITRELFQQIGGYAEVPLLEDVLMAKKVRPKVFPEYVTTSSRRYKQKGILKTVLLHRAIMLGFTLGISPEALAKWRR